MTKPTNKPTNKRPRQTKTTTTKNDDRRIERWLILPDIHASVAGDHDIAALQTVEAFMADQKWDGYLNLGDLIDFGIISAHNTMNLREVEGGRILEEYRVAEHILTRHEKIIRDNNPAARLVYLEGNHEYRIERLIDANPAMEGVLEVEKVLPLQKLGIEWIRSWSRGELFNLGKCSFHHGLYANDHHAKKMVQRFGKSVLYGHTHDLQVYSSHGATPDDVKVGASLGCLCKVPQRYLKGSPTRWVQAITIFESCQDTGDFWFNSIRINNGKLIYNGKVYGGN